MITDIVAPNIFMPKINWNIITFRCKKPIQYDAFEQQVAKIVKEETGIDPLELRHYRGGKQVQSRQLFLVMMATYTNRTYESISAIVGKDHATINSSKKSVSNFKDTDKRYAAMYERIETKVKLIK